MGSKAKRKAIQISIAKSRHNHNLKRRDCVYRPYGIIDTSSSSWIEATRTAQTLEEIENALMPRNLKHLLDAEHSPFNRNILPRNAFVFERRLDVPKVFSIIKNGRDSFSFLRNLVSALIH